MKDLIQFMQNYGQFMPNLNATTGVWYVHKRGNIYYFRNGKVESFTGNKYYFILNILAH